MRDLANEAVLHRVEVNVINMPLQITFIADLELPETALPDALSRLAILLILHRARREVSGETGFDLTPSRVKVVAARRHPPTGAQMIGQDANCQGLKRLSGVNSSILATKQIDVIREPERSASVTVK
jgi:hypothetical protein